ncbi:MAG TPA: alpha-galactosidase, partial [Vicinamibacterales bacterium]|nr:alpha-galactosidase [Vicinamibacterales bacterium]
MRRALLLVLPALFAALAGPAGAQRPSDALAPTPPMGWNSWNRFACDVSEQLIRETADAMVASGMRDAGYTYVVIDDCWQVARDSAGTIVADPERFPSGMKALADYVHAQGLKFGLYSDAGLKTCEGRPGSRGYEYQDARTYAAWGVDYLKYDWCHHGTQNAEASYRLMRDALDASGRLITLSICEWGSNQPWLWARDIGHLWRTTGDIKDCWVCERGLSWTSILDRQVGLESYAGPGGWNDPDMLEVGNGGMTLVEYRAHFSMWAILAAPLMAGNDLRSMTPETRDILTNREVIAVDQDPLGRQGRKVRDDGDVEVWARELADGSRAVALLNRGEAA